MQYSCKVLNKIKHKYLFSTQTSIIFFSIFFLFILMLLNLYQLDFFLREQRRRERGWVGGIQQYFHYDFYLENPLECVADFSYLIEIGNEFLWSSLSVFLSHHCLKQKEEEEVESRNRCASSLEPITILLLLFLDLCRTLYQIPPNVSNPTLLSRYHRVRTDRLV